MNNSIKFVFLISGIASIILLLMKNFPEAMNNDDNRVSLISSLVLLTYFILRISNSSLPISSILKQIFGWIFIIFIILAGYSYKFELIQFSNRILANLLPTHGQMMDDNQSMLFYAGSNGHFTISAILNDQTDVNFLLDTGASTVSLTAEDAIALGFDPNSLNYNTPFNTANGVSWGARVMIDKIQIGSITINDVPASVSKAGSLDTSLLGMNFLNRLSSFKIQDNTLTLTK